MSLPDAFVCKLHLHQRIFRGQSVHRFILAVLSRCRSLIRIFTVATNAFRLFGTVWDSFRIALAPKLLRDSLEQVWPIGFQDRSFLTTRKNAVICTHVIFVFHRRSLDIKTYFLACLGDHTDHRSLFNAASRLIGVHCYIVTATPRCASERTHNSSARVQKQTHQPERWEASCNMGFTHHRSICNIVGLRARNGMDCQREWG